MAALSESEAHQGRDLPKVETLLSGRNMRSPENDELPDEGPEKSLIPRYDTRPVFPLYVRCRYIEASSVVGLLVVWGCGVACITIASILLNRQFLFSMPEDVAAGAMNTAFLPSGTASLSDGSEVYALLVTALVTLCTESTGFIHDVCLRWNIFQEGRLAWVTLPRLLTTSKTSWSTRTLSNLLYFLTLTVAYTACSQIFLAATFSEMPYASGENPSQIGTLANGPALMALGASLVLQAALVSWIYLSSRRYVKSWSSNPLTITLACLVSDSRLRETEHIAFRSIESVAARIHRASRQIQQRQTQSTSAGKPSKSQPSLCETRPKPTQALFVPIILLPLLVLVCAGAIASAYHNAYESPSFNEFGSNSAKLNYLISETINNGYFGSPAISPFSWQVQFSGDGDNSLEAPPARMSEAVTLFLSLLIICVFQTILTFVLHAVELFANSFRDERLWRRAAAKHGTSLNPNSLMVFLTSPANVLLLVLKVLTHWLFNRCLLPLIALYHDPALTYTEPGGGTVHIGGPKEITHYWRSSMMQIKAFSIPAWFLMAATVILAVLAAFLGFRKPRGPQPSAFGHIQTLADLVDDWGNGKRLFWGDKGASEDGYSRRAGTAGSSEEVGPVQMDAEYT